ncbi:hypothetical protein ACEWY4_019846 [Coilia grayii]|uniref:C2H2-type domain-containing protein n=1 Tax=Coilia grayii TaxID=363190 RepID=A0ABD1JAW5_9TELE
MTHELNRCCQTPIPAPVALMEPQDLKENMEVPNEGPFKEEINHTSEIYQEITQTDLKAVSGTVLDSHPLENNFIKDGDGTECTPTKPKPLVDAFKDFNVNTNSQEPKEDSSITPDIPDAYSDVSSCSEPDDGETMKCNEIVEADQIAETHETQSTKNPSNLDCQSVVENGIAMKPDVCESTEFSCEMMKQKVEQQSLLEDQYSNISSPEQERHTSILKEEGKVLQQDLGTTSETVLDHVLEPLSAVDGPLTADVHNIMNADTTPSSVQNEDSFVDNNTVTSIFSAPTDEVLEKTPIPIASPSKTSTSQSPQTKTLDSSIDSDFRKTEKDLSHGLEMEHGSFEFLETCLKNSIAKSSFNLERTSEMPDLTFCDASDQIPSQANCSRQEPGQHEQGTLESVADSVTHGSSLCEAQDLFGDQNDETELTGVSTEQEADTREDKSNFNEGTSNDIAGVVRLVESHNMKKTLDPIVVLDYKEQIYNQVGIYRCAQCSATAESVDHLVEHHHHQHSKLYFQLCQTCRRYLTSCQAAEHHSCEQSELEQPGILTKSLQQCVGEDSKTTKRKLHKCRFCPLFFKKLGHFQMHQLRHKKTKFRCSGCGFYFAQSGSLNRHLQLNRCIGSKSQTTTEWHPESIKNTMETSATAPHGIQECFVKLVDIYRRDPISSPNRCKICNKTFVLRAQYNSHMKMHSSEKPYKCADCDKAFKYSWNLNRHRREQCDRVSKTYKEERSTLSPEPYRRERDTSVSSPHSVTSRYQCPLCPRLFKYSYNLTRHLRVQCFKDYMQMQRKAKTSSRCKCPLCGARFTLVCNMGRHLRKTCLPAYRDKEIHRQEKDGDHLGGKQRKERESGLGGKSKLKPLANKQMSNNGTYYQCKLCPAVFSHSSGLFKHEHKHRLSAKTGKKVRYRTSNPDELRVTSYSEPKVETLDPTKGGPLSCRFCGKNFTMLLYLKKHMALHKGDKPYSCQQCGQRFKKQAYLIAHMQCHKRKVQCSVCNKIFPTIAELLEHRRSHDNKGMLKCPDCAMEFRFPVYLLRHLVTHERRDKQKKEKQDIKVKPVQKQSEKLRSPEASKQQFMCSLCQKSFVDAKALSDHCVSHLPKNSSKCQHCKKQFSSRAGLVRHMRLHTGEKPFSCKQCGQSYYRMEPLKVHMEQCTSTLMVTEKYDKKDTIKTEQKEVKPTVRKVKQFKCRQCPHSFLWLSSLTKHLNGHKLKILAPCSKCGRCYRKKVVAWHEKTCNGKLSNTTILFPCRKCDRSFSRMDNKNVHERNCKATAHETSLTKKGPQDIGTVVKDRLPHRCPHCPKSFKYRSYLLKHLPSHLAEKPYACMYCGHKYASQRRYLHHEAFCDGVFRRKSATLQEANTEEVASTGYRMAKTDGTDGQYRCKFCNKNFSKARNLRRHILTHTDVKPYRCKTCDSCFSRHDHLKVHQNRCKGKKRKLEVRLPKISPKHEGTGWQNYLKTKQNEVFQCKICFKEFSCQKNLGRHTALKHVSNKPFSCKRCGTSFSSTAALKKHTLMVKCKKRVIPDSAAKTVNAKVSERQCRETAKLLQRIQGHYSQKLKFQCAYCPRRFKNRPQLQVHTRLHTGEKPYGCENCGERFIRRDYLQRHLIKCTSVGEATKRALCDKCGQLFPTEALQNHKTHCVINVDKVNNIETNTTSPPKIRTFSCTNCSDKFLLFSQLQQHFLSAHREDTMQKPSNDYEELLIKKELLDEEHTESSVQYDVDNEEIEEKPYSCPYCSMRFINNSGLGMHVRTHTASYPFSCKKCSKGFWSKAVQQKHMRKCQVQSQNSPTPASAESTKPVSEEKSAVLVFNKGSNTTGTGVLQTEFSCKTGNRKTPRNVEQRLGHGDLSDKTNTSSNKYQCSECDQSFSDGLMLISHLENHGREEFLRKKSCNICGKAFSKPVALSKHMSTHHDKKTPYTCQICSKSFRFPSDLETHKWYHDPSRPFCCSKCDLRFNTQKSLNQHATMAHPITYTCHPCNRTYTTKKVYLRHTRAKHGTGIGANSDEGNGSSADQFGMEVNIDDGSDISDVRDVNEASDDDSDSAPYFPCHVCGKTFSTSESLEDHQRCHLGEKPHECEECGKCFFQLVNLQQHQRSHKSEFQCQTCGRGFVSLFALKKHKHSHGKNRPYRCSKCNLSFTGPSQLAEHMATHRDENFPCDLCDRTFSCKISRAEHRKTHSEQEEELPPLIPPSSTPPLTSPPSVSSSSPKEQIGGFKYRCGICTMHFRDPEQLSEHGCKAAKERPYACPECDKHFLHGSHLKKHQLSHQLAGPYRYQCNQCHMNFTYRHHFLGHLRSHGNEKESEDAIGSGDKLPTESRDPDNIYQCPICPKSYSQAMELADHLTIHSFMCKVCNMSFSSKAKLAEHEQCHLTATTQYECTECGESFLGSDAFRQHQCAQRQRSFTENRSESKLSSPKSLKHSSKSSRVNEEEEEVDVGEDFYNCPVCKKRFSSQAELGEHQKSQPECRPYKCKVCGKGFAKRRYLSRHQLIHERPFRCNDCPQSFDTESSLSAHREMHNANREFQCSICTKNFTTAQDLLRHERKHAEQQSGAHRCDMCYKSFGHLSLLRKHQETHVGEVVYECTECDKAFAFFHLLEEHQRTHASFSTSPTLQNPGLDQM